ncbi:MAG: hypothetical protein ABIO57_02010 [Candidatus Paceibacterota bacterium]
MRKNYLDYEKTNIAFSSETILKTVSMVDSIFEYDKSQPYVDYPCTAIIKVAHMRVCPSRFFLLRKDLSNKLVVDHRLHQMKNIPENLLIEAQQSKFSYVHLLVKRRIYFNGKQELELIISPHQSQLGYFSNKTFLTKKGLAFLEGREILSLQKKMLLKLHMLVAKFPHLAQILQLPIVVQSKQAA